MLDLVDEGSFTERAATMSIAWTRLDRASIGPEMIRCDIGLRNDLPGPRLTIRCEACLREFCQSWVAERGSESWTSTAR